MVTIVTCTWGVSKCSCKALQRLLFGSSTVINAGSGTVGVNKENAIARIVADSCDESAVLTQGSSNVHAG